MLGAALFVAVITPMPASASSQSPEQVAKQTVQKILQDMKGHRQQLRNNSAQLRALINKDLMPVVDLDYTSQLTLGRYWREATPEQRNKFEKAFKNMLIQNYGDALLKLKSGDNMQYLPVRAPANASNVTFNAIYHSPNGHNVHLALKMHKVHGQWEIYDASGENLSFVTNFKEQFTNRIQQVGLSKFIQQMQQRYGTSSG